MTDDPDKVTRLPVKFKEPPPGERTLLGPWEVPRGPNGCDHLLCAYHVVPSEAEVTCSRCGTKLNPMWVLAQLATHDRRYAEQQQAAKEASARLEERRRCKCQHCGKFTRIRNL